MKAVLVLLVLAAATTAAAAGHMPVTASFLRYENVTAVFNASKTFEVVSADLAVSQRHGCDGEGGWNQCLHYIAQELLERPTQVGGLTVFGLVDIGGGSGSDSSTSLSSFYTSPLADAEFSAQLVGCEPLLRHCLLLSTCRTLIGCLAALEGVIGSGFFVGFLY